MYRFKLNAIPRIVRRSVVICECVWNFSWTTTKKYENHRKLLYECIWNRIMYTNLFCFTYSYMYERWKWIRKTEKKQKIPWKCVHTEKFLLLNILINANINTIKLWLASQYGEILKWNFLNENPREGRGAYRPLHKTVESVWCVLRWGSCKNELL